MQAKSSKSISGAIQVVNSIKTSIATSASPASYSGAQLNGAIGAAAMSLPRTIIVTLSSSAGSYVNGSTITITGTVDGVAGSTDVLTISGTAGGTTVTSVKFFSQVSQIDIQAQSNTSGAFQFGTNDVLVNGAQLRVGTIGNLHLKYADPAGTVDTIPSVQAGEPVPAIVSIVYGDSTVQNLTAYYL